MLSNSIELKNESFDFPPKVLYKNRYCNQDDFSFLVCGRRNENKIQIDTVYKLDGPDFDCKKYTSLPTLLYGCKIAVVNSD